MLEEVFLTRYSIKNINSLFFNTIVLSPNLAINCITSHECPQIFHFIMELLFLSCQYDIDGTAMLYNDLRII